MMKTNAVRKIGDALWEATKEDWTLTILYDLTEPTCPSATIAPEPDEDEISDLPTFRSGGNTVDDAVQRVITQAEAWLAAEHPARVATMEGLIR